MRNPFRYFNSSPEIIRLAVTAPPPWSNGASARLEKLREGFVLTGRLTSDNAPTGGWSRSKHPDRVHKEGRRTSHLIHFDRHGYAMMGGQLRRRYPWGLK